MIQKNTKSKIIFIARCIELVADALNESNEQIEIQIPCTNEEGVFYFHDLYTTLVNLFDSCGIQLEITRAENNKLLCIMLTRKYTI